MPRIHRDFVADLKARVDLHDVVAPYVTLKRAGADFKGLSPFNSEKTPSFVVHPDQGFFKCFSSGESGDAISFIQKVENLDFMEAIEHLATRFHVPIRYEEGSSAEAPQARSRKKALLEAQETAAAWFRENFLAKNEDGAYVRNYLEEIRGFSPEIADTFGIGYAPADAFSLPKFLQTKGFAEEELDDSGLFFERRNGKRFFPRFRGRLMIPIRDNQSRVVGFTARQLPVTPEDDPTREAKYVNSPETPLFHKGRILFNLDKARANVRNGERFLVVEGQLDAIRCWEQGARTVVAPQGTALTEDQANLLKRYRCGGVDCLLDGDDAGRKAALRALPLFLQAGLDARFLRLDPGQDPDELLRQRGLAALDDLTANALGPIEFALSSHLDGIPDPTPVQRNAVLKHVFELLAATDSLVTRDAYLSQAARLLRINETSAQREFRIHLRSQTKRPTAPSANNSPPNGAGRLTTAEGDLLSFALHKEEIAGALAGVVEPEWLDLSTPTGSILSKILAEIREDTWEGLPTLDLLTDSDEERNAAYAALAEPPTHEDPGAMAESCLQTVFLRHVKRREESVNERFANLPPDSGDELSRLHEQLLALRNLRKDPPTLSLSNPIATQPSRTHADHHQDRKESRAQNRSQEGDRRQKEGPGRQDEDIQEACVQDRPQGLRQKSAGRQDEDVQEACVQEACVQDRPQGSREEDFLP